MPETIPQIRPSFNRSLRLETRPELLSADTGALVQRELMDRSGLIDWLTGRLHDPRHPSSIRYPLSDLLRTRLLLLGQGWRDQSDADRLRQDPSLRVASEDSSGHGGLGGGPGAGVAADLVPTAGHAQPGGEPSGPAPGGDGAGVPSDRDDRRPAAKTGEKDPTEEETEKDDVPGRGRSPGRGPWASPGKRMERILSPADVPRVGGELCRDGGPDRRGDFSGSQLPGEKGAEVDATGGGPLSRASVRLDDRADGCGVPGAGAAEGAGVEKRALYRSNPQE